MSDIDTKALALLNDKKLPAWLPRTLTQLMEIADDVLPGAAGVDKKAWVTKAVKDLARKHDIKAIPDVIENAIEDALISVAIEVLWAFVFKPVRDPEEGLGLHMKPSTMAAMLPGARFSFRELL